MSVLVTVLEVIAILGLLAGISIMALILGAMLALIFEDGLPKIGRDGRG